MDWPKNDVWIPENTSVLRILRVVISAICLRRFDLDDLHQL